MHLAKRYDFLNRFNIFTFSEPIVKLSLRVFLFHCCHVYTGYSPSDKKSSNLEKVQSNGIIGSRENANMKSNEG